MLRMFAFLLIMLSPALQASTASLEDFARHQQFIDVKISPTGQYLAATRRAESGNIELVVIDRIKMQVISQRFFPGADSINSFTWANAERLVLSLAREVGALEQPVLTGELFAVNADGKRPIMLTGYRSRDRETTVSQVIDWLSQDEDDIVISSYNWRNKEPFVEFYQLNINSGRKKRLGNAPIRAIRGTQIRALTDSEGYPKLVVGVDPKNNTKLVMLYRAERSGDWQQLVQYDRAVGSFTPLTFAPDNNAIYGISDSQTNTQAIARFDLSSAKEEIIAVNSDVDLFPIYSMRNGRPAELIGASFEHEKIDTVFFNDVEDKVFSANVQGLVAAFEQKVVQVQSATADNKLMVLSVSSANDPTAFYMFDTEKKQVVFLLDAVPWLADKKLPQTKIIQYKARDGQPISALLTLPVDTDAKNLPLVLLPHGGPHGIRDSIAVLDEDVKVLASNGYAVLQPNFRGSGGFGKAFLTAGYKKWGTLMIDDMTDGVRYLIDQGVVDPRRVAVYGASYGGYAALMSAIREPELYRCAINFVGISDLALMYEEGDTTESAIGIDTLELFLGRSDEVLKGQSAIHNLDKLKAPVMIIHGTEDKRVPLVQAEVLRKALDERSHPYEWLVKEKEGHGFYKPENEVERWQKMLAFLAKHMAI